MLNIRVSRRARPRALGLALLATASASACTTPPGGGNGGSGGPTACANVEIVTARGTGESQTAAFGLSGLNNGIASRTNGVIYQVVYPASSDFLGSPPVGVRDALARITARAAQCPAMRFFLTGYSQGGMVITGVLQQITPALAARVAGGVIYGNPYYKGGSPTAAGPDRTANGIAPGGIPASWGGKVRDYCLQGDTVCGSSGGNVGAHLQYPTSPLQQEAITWAVARINGG